MALTPDEVQRHVNDARGAVAELCEVARAAGHHRRYEIRAIEKIGLSLAQAIEALAREVRQ